MVRVIVESVDYDIVVFISAILSDDMYLCTASRTTVVGETAFLDKRDGWVCIADLGGDGEVIRRKVVKVAHIIHTHDIVAEVALAEAGDSRALEGDTSCPCAVDKFYVVNTKKIIFIS